MHRNPALTVDVVVIEGNKILLVKRGQSPHQGEWALPGGFVE
ncbi:MAG: NUDIX hydrolase, partial [Candidatus Thorarchaeota archaeon]|nr:NUDIX hydrolase [Candidatus Thorarchaeota archaeon]